MINRETKYHQPEDTDMDFDDEVWNYLILDDDEAVERFIEMRRMEFREEWLQYLEEAEACE